MSILTIVITLVIVGVVLWAEWVYSNECKYQKNT